MHFTKKILIEAVVVVSFSLVFAAGSGVLSSNFISKTSDGTLSTNLAQTGEVLGAQITKSQLPDGTGTCPSQSPIGGVIDANGKKAIISKTQSYKIPSICFENVSKANENGYF